MTKQAINQHLARAEALGDDLPRVAGPQHNAKLRSGSSVDITRLMSRETKTRPERVFSCPHY